MGKTEISSEKQITKDIVIYEIFEKFPEKTKEIAEEITNAGLHCIGCGASMFETLEGGMLVHGMSEKKINELVERLNKIIQE